MTESMLRIALPYCLQKLADGRFIVLNRRYKPLGVSSREHVDYDAHPSACHISGLTGAVAAKLSWDGSADTAAIWLYRDGLLPTASPENWAAYCARLQLLATLQRSV